MARTRANGTTRSSSRAGGLTLVLAVMVGLAFGPASAFAAQPKDVVAGSNANFSCSVLTNGSVNCWGYNGHNELGDGSTVDRSTPAPVKGVSNAKRVALSDYSACALLDDSTVKCWGHNANGQIGDGTTTQRSSAVAVPGLSGVTSISAGRQHVCA